MKLEVDAPQSTWMAHQSNAYPTDQYDGMTFDGFVKAMCQSDECDAQGQ